MESSVASKPETKPGASEDPEMWRHGVSVAGRPRTWTGRIVSLDEWRKLTEWQRHGLTGQQ